MPRALRILATADLHIGRRPSRVGAALEPARCSAAAMFAAIVELAITERVDAVLLSGDLVDQQNKFHEAFGPLERGLRKLSDAAIPTFAVAGNHDHDVLPRLLDDLHLPHFHLLGRAGTWEHRTLTVGGQPLTLLGWSFPAERTWDNPLRQLPTTGLPPGLVVGLLHGDLDQPDSAYAPLPLRDLQNSPVAAWVLGHVHKPRWEAPPGKAAFLYPGSPQALDPGETGAHGPWLLSFDPAGRATAHMLPLSLVRYDGLEIDCSAWETRDALDFHLPRRLRQHVEHHCADAGPLALCLLRLRLTGATALHRQLPSWRNDLLAIDVPVGNIRLRVDDVELQTRPPIALHTLADSGGVLGDLARLALELQQPAAPLDSDTTPLVTAAAEAVDAVCGARAFAPLNSAAHPVPDRPAVRQLLLRQSLQLLDELLEQKQIGAAGE